MYEQISIFDIQENRSDSTLYNEDCLKVMAGMSDESIDLVVTDCPYRIVGGGMGSDKHQPGGIFKPNRKDSHGNPYYGDNNHVSLCGMFNDYDPNTYAKEGKLFKHNDIKFKEWLPDVYRVLKQGTHCYIMINPRNLKELQEECEKVGFIFQQLIIWDKGTQAPNKYYLNAVELILMLRKGRAKNINHMGTKNILRVKNIIRTKKHPTEKPAELMEILIDNSTMEGELVLDPFMGVGSTGVACRRLNRNFIGIEIDEKYYKIAEQRLNGMG